MRLSIITIDADGSPSGHIAWYNHYTGKQEVRVLRPPARNERFGVQKMEMLAIYFAIVKNLRQISILAGCRKKEQIVVNIRSDSKTCIEQLQGISRIRDAVLQRICASIRKILDKIPCIIVFKHLERARNQAGLLLEQKRRKEIEKQLKHQYQKYYYSTGRFVLDRPYRLATTSV